MKYIFTFGVTVILFLTVHEGSASVCEQENIFGLTTHFTCPQPGDPQNAQFCCGTERNRYCCETPFGIDEEVLKQFADKLPVILGVIGAVIIGLIVLCIVCCCCCPFCLLHKRRNRGAVHNPNTADVTVTQPLQPMQPYPGQQPYPAQGGYPPQPQPYAPQPYPPQGYPAQPGYPPQPQPYPPQANPPAVYPDLSEK